MKSKEPNPPQTGTGHNGELLPGKRLNNQDERSKKMRLILQHRKLQLKVMESENKENELKMKVRQLRTELKHVQDEYKGLWLQFYC